MPGQSIRLLCDVSAAPALAMRFRRYCGLRIFAFDMRRSMRATIPSHGGDHNDLGIDSEIVFQRLARIDRDGYRTWTAEWIEGRLHRRCEASMRLGYFSTSPPLTRVRSGSCTRRRCR